MRLPHIKRATKEKDKEGAPPPKGQRRSRLLLVSLFVLLGGFVLMLRSAYLAPTPGDSLTLDQVYALAQGNRLKSVRFLDQKAIIVGQKCLDPPASGTEPVGLRPQRCYDTSEAFHAAYPSSQVATQQLIDVIRNSSGARIEVDRQGTVAVVKVVTTFLFPLLVLANLFALIFLARSGDSGVSDVAGFGRIGKGKRKGENSVAAVTFANVAGAGEAVTELREVIDYLTEPARFAAYGAAPPKGVLLFGPPGCGKTLLARATAGESGVPFFSASGTEFVESLVGVGAARVRDLFRQVREVAPAILFIDEIDAVGRRRSGEGSSGGEREQTLNQLLVELDGFDVSSGIVIMGATNRPDILDPALLRPGRFDRHITMEAPDIQGRRAILELHAKDRPFTSDVDLGNLAARTPGFTGADLANVINEAALLAIRDEAGTMISPMHLSEAVLRVLHGPQRRGRILVAEERRRLAFHEAGHALVASAVGCGREVQRVSIVARGRGLAQSVIGDDEHTVHTAANMRARLAMAMGGVAAEVLVLGDSSTTAQDDIVKATMMAKEMVGVYGMSASLGRVRLLTPKSGGFLGGDEATLDMVSGPTMAEFDAEVRRLITSAEVDATKLLKVHRSRLDNLAEAVLDHETLEGAALEELLAPVAQSSNGAGPALEDGHAPTGRRDTGSPTRSTRR